MTERCVLVADPAGLHARQAARLVRLASHYGSRITLRHGGREADARSLIEILTLGVGPSMEITLVADGADAEEALAAMALDLSSGPPPGDVAAAPGHEAVPPADVAVSHGHEAAPTAGASRAPAPSSTPDT